MTQPRPFHERQPLLEALSTLGEAVPEPSPTRPRGDSLAIEQLLHTLVCTLPRSLLAPRRLALEEVLRHELVERMLSREDLPAVLPCPPEDFRERLLRPGWLSHEVGGWLSEQAGSEAGGLLDDVLAWGRASR